jgi:hypothetical protein
MSFRDRTDKLLDTALNVFGEENQVEYLPKSGGTFTIRGIYDEAWEETDPDTLITISTTQPNVGIKYNDLPGNVFPKIDDRLCVREKMFKVVDVREDGQWGLTLFLHKEE